MIITVSACPTTVSFLNGNALPVGGARELTVNWTDS